MKIEYDEYNYNFKGYVENIQVSELNIWVEGNEHESRHHNNPRHWINGINTKQEYRKKGYARRLIKEAISKYGTVFISTASAFEHNQGNDNSARHLTDDGRALMQRLKEKDILQPEWFINPFL
jgi:GNAT superfamily N-acetyltransferase